MGIARIGAIAQLKMDGENVASMMSRLSSLSRKTLLLQWIDRRIGVPVCFLLTVGRKISGLLAGDEPAAPVRKILLLKLAEQGSTVLARAAIAEAVAKVGRENVYFLAFDENRFIVDLLDIIPRENVLTVKTGSIPSMIASGLAQVRAIRRMRIDATVDLEFFSRFSAAISFICASRIRVGFHTYFGEGPYRGDLMTHRVLYNPQQHASTTFLSLVTAIEADPRKLPSFNVRLPVITTLPEFAPAESEVAQAKALIASLSPIPHPRVILLNANASDLIPLRKWEASNYVLLAQKLIAAFPDVVVGFTGAPDEQGPISDLVSEVGSDRCLVLAGRTDLRQLLVVCGLSEVLVTNDSGPAHFAALTPIDVVTLFGPESPLLFAAIGPRQHPLWAGIACSPCVNAFNNRQTACQDNQCMKRITVDQVFDEVRQIYLDRAAG